MKKISILDDYQGVALNMASWEKLKDRAEISVLQEHIADVGALAQRLAGTHILVVNRERTAISSELLKRLPDLQLIVTSGKRNAAIDMITAAERGITVCATGSYGYPTAEMVWAMILGFARHIPTETKNMKSGGWQTTVGMGLQGKTLGVLGVGRVGSDVAKIGVAFGMKVLGWSRSFNDERAAELGIQSASFEHILREADVISLHMPLTAATQHLISQPELAMMKPGVLLVNTARGPLINEAALIDALQQRRIRGAALDVYAVEPLPTDHPLRQLDNVLLTPHLGYVIEENYRMQYGLVVDNIEAWLNGTPVRVIAAPASH